MRSPYRETDPQTLAVLSAALHSPGRATRVRAVAMLALVLCPEREQWLDRALGDPDRAVRETALIVRAWAPHAEHPAWPSREDLAPGFVAHDQCEPVERELLGGRGYEWEYAVEVWRTDGILVGCYFVTTCAEDDAHARSLALGRAILESSGALGDRFDPECAATFVVDKARRIRGSTRG